MTSTVGERHHGPTEPQPWWKTAVVYQVYPRSFSDSNGDGVGDLSGITTRLDYLAKLGVDVIWLSPIYESPQDDNGYDISDYRAIDPVFGTLDDLDNLVREVHDRGMRLIMDLVVNHTSDEHPWFVESRASTDSPKRDWYWWRPPREGLAPGTPGAEPNNWGAAFSGPAWDYDEASGEYYLHLFSRKQPDLNWESEGLRQAIYEMMRWWLDRGVDGFRMDVINFISKVPGLPNGIVEGPSPYGDGHPYFANGPRLHDFLQEMHLEVFASRADRCLRVGETPRVTIDVAQLLTDPDRHELDMVFQFEHVDLDHGQDKWSTRPVALSDLKASLARWQMGMAGVGWNSLYWCNHDQPRVVSRFGDDGHYRVASAKALATVLHLQRGTPYVYQGEELGMTNAPFASIEDFRDIESTRAYVQAVVAEGSNQGEILAALRERSRDNARTPMHWDSSPHAGFTTGDPWLPVNPNHDVINAENAMRDVTSVFHHYRKLIELRHHDRAVTDGDFELYLPDDEQVFAFVRRLGSSELLVVANLSGAATTAEIPGAVGWAHAEVVLEDRTGTGLSWQMTRELGPWESFVLRRGPYLRN